MKQNASKTVEDPEAKIGEKKNEKTSYNDQLNKIKTKREQIQDEIKARKKENEKKFKEKIRKSHFINRKTSKG